MPSVNWFYAGLAIDACQILIFKRIEEGHQKI